MANNVESPPTLPDPNAFLPGIVLRGDVFELIPECLNNALSFHGAGFAFQQIWEDGICQSSDMSIPQDGGSNDIPIATWRIPIISDRHDSISIQVRGYHTALAIGGDVEFRSENAGDSVTAALGNGAAAADSWTDVGSLDIADTGGGDGYEVITMYLVADMMAGFSEIVQVMAEYGPLADPLPAETITTNDVAGIPFGLDTVTGPDRPLPAVRGHQMINTLTALYARPRVLLNWSGLDSSYTGVDAAHENPPAHGIRSAVVRLPFDVFDDERYAIHAYLRNNGDGGPNESVAFDVFDHRIQVDDDTEGWVVETFDNVPANGARVGNAPLSIIRDGLETPVGVVRTLAVWGP